MSANDNGKTALTFEEAVEVWRRHWAGEFQHHVASHFKVNPGRVSEVLKEKKHIGSRQEAENAWKKQA
jgi:alkanesulfonate monooxygenase SsuD/methylene tetrahydromethanopterin reductase-like flavin-dependent oxidoreductase (luciferase family)